MALRAQGWDRFSRFSKWHSVVVPREFQNVTLADCADDCVITAVPEFLTAFRESTSDQERAEALIFLGHVVGDAHQPLHVSFADDRGGNQIQVRGQFYSQRNLHSVWDSGIVSKAIGAHGWRIYARRLWGEITDEERQAWSRGDALGWAQESFEIATMEEVGYCGSTCEAGQATRTRTLQHSYQSRFQDVVEMRLRQAGVRLANEIRGGARAPNGGDGGEAARVVRQYEKRVRLDLEAARSDLEDLRNLTPMKDINGREVYAAEDVNKALASISDQIFSSFDDDQAAPLKATAQEWVSESLPSTAIQLTEVTMSDGTRHKIAAVTAKDVRPVLNRFIEFVEGVLFPPSLTPKLTVSSNPPEATFSLFFGQEKTSRYRVHTDDSVDDVWVGKYLARIEKDGYVAGEDIINLFVDGRTKIRCKLVREGEPGKSTCWQVSR
jgi:hypothetical protein